ncbi:MAG: hypothetical protein ACJ72N_19435 [Labedaea sp.]
MLRIGRIGVPLAALAIVSSLATPASATGADSVILLPGASSAEGVAAGKGTTFYAGDLFRGDIFRGDIRRGAAARFIDAPDGRMAVGMAADVRHDLLFVAGGPGKAYVYDTRTRATVASYDFADPAASFINDVALTPFGAYFTDSLQAKLFFVPLVHGRPGPFRALVLSGPAADTSGAFNLNGIRAVDNGRALIVAHTALGQVFTVNPVTGASALIAGVSVPIADGLELDGRRLWVVQNSNNKITEWRLRGDLSAGTLTETITSNDFHVPTTAALFGHRLATVNSHFDTGNPPNSPTYEVVVVHS